MASRFAQAPPLHAVHSNPPATQQQQPAVFVRPVRAANLADELDTIRFLLPLYPYITIDTEYPGNVCRFSAPGVREEDLTPTARYDVARANVDGLHVLQLGITLCNANGDLPVLAGPRGPEPSVWQVGFSDFDLRRDPHSEPSIRFLRSRGVNFDDLRADGVSARAFAATLVGSGVVSSLNRNWLTWVAFGGLYDFGFLLKMLTGGRPLPATRDEFVAKLGEYLGARVYDAKYVASRLPTGLVLSGGLMKVARALDALAAVTEPGQAGEKSLVACQVFTRMKGLFFQRYNVAVHAGRIDGLH